MNRARLTREVRELLDTYKGTVGGKVLVDTKHYFEDMGFEKPVVINHEMIEQFREAHPGYPYFPRAT